MTTKLQADLHVGENTPEYVAYLLMRQIANVEGKSFFQEENGADRAWILDTYAECLLAAKGYRAPKAKASAA